MKYVQVNDNNYRSLQKSSYSTVASKEFTGRVLN